MFLCPWSLALLTYLFVYPKYPLAHIWIIFTCYITSKYFAIIPVTVLKQKLTCSLNNLFISHPYLQNKLPIPIILINILIKTNDDTSTTLKKSLVHPPYTWKPVAAYFLYYIYCFYGRYFSLQLPYVSNKCANMSDVHSNINIAANRYQYVSMDMY